MFVYLKCLFRNMYKLSYIFSVCPSLSTKERIPKDKGIPYLLMDVCSSNNGLADPFGWTSLEKSPLTKINPSLCNFFKIIFKTIHLYAHIVIQYGCACMLVNLYLCGTSHAQIPIWKDG